jgi:methylenetetrahydrofolate dehydrogenase (NADP+)/methenyltetrahydrofolate cyclohydrolase
VTAKIIDGVELSRQMREDLSRRAHTLAARGQRPGLAVILVGEDPASAVYVRVLALLQSSASMIECNITHY